MHRRLRRAALGAISVVLCLPATAVAATRCPGTKVAVVVNGKRTCRPATFGKASVGAPDAPTVTTNAVLDRSGTTIPRQRLRAGGSLPATLSGPSAALLRTTIAQARARAYALGVGALAAPAAPMRRALDALPRRTGSVEFTGGSVTRTGPSSASIGVSATVTDGAWKGDVELSMNLSNEAGRFSIEGFDVKVTTTEDGIYRKSVAVGGNVKTPAPATCPDANGRIEYRETTSGRRTDTLTGKIGPATIGKTTNAHTGQSSITAIGQMSADARLSTITYTATRNFDYAASGAILAFYNPRVRLGLRVTASGSLDPATGRALPGSSVTAKATAFGTDDDAATRAKLADQVDKVVAGILGDVLKQMRIAETNARDGKCTKIEVAPNPATLAPKAKTSVAPKLLTTPDGAVVNATWTATPTRGSVSPGTQKSSAPTFTVTGAASGPQTAAMTIRAVSPAGISAVPWTATGGSFPATYSGPVTYTETLGPTTLTWDGEAVYTLASQQTNPDGSRQALYDLTSFTVGGYSYAESFSGCAYTTTAFGPTAIAAGDVEIQVGADGTWKAAILVDASLGNQTMVCPPPLQGGTGLQKAFLNTRTPALGLRPMQEGGRISELHAVDLLSAPGGTADASWDLAPPPPAP